MTLRTAGEQYGHENDDGDGRNEQGRDPLEVRTGPLVASRHHFTVMRARPNEVFP